MAERFARVIVGARVAVVLAWIAAAVIVAMELPTLGEAQTARWVNSCRWTRRRSRHGSDFNQQERVDAANAYARTLHAPPTEFVGLTGVVPAQAEQADIIADTPPRMELATLALVA